MKKSRLFLALLFTSLLCCCAKATGSAKSEGLFEYKEIYLPDAIDHQGELL